MNERNGIIQLTELLVVTAAFIEVGLESIGINWGL
jgi:hypothetical protein